METEAKLAHGRAEIQTRMAKGFLSKPFRMAQTLYLWPFWPQQNKLHNTKGIYENNAEVGAGKAPVAAG